MPTIQVRFPIRFRKVKQKISRDLFWYDIRLQKMMKFSGTRLEFDFRSDGHPEQPQRRLMPRVVMAEENVVIRSRSKQDILNWWREYEAYNSTNAELLTSTITNQEATFEVPDEELNEFVESLENENFDYEIL